VITSDSYRVSVREKFISVLLRFIVVSYNWTITYGHHYDLYRDFVRLHCFGLSFISPRSYEDVLKKHLNLGDLIKLNIVLSWILCKCLLTLFHLNIGFIWCARHHSSRSGPWKVVNQSEVL
jgi:hypothetical protein